MSQADLEQTMRVLNMHLEPLQNILADHDTQEIMVNRFEQIFVESRGCIRRAEGISVKPASLSTAITMMTNINGKPHGPLLDARLPGIRIAAARESVAVRGDMLCIRKHGVKQRSLDDYYQDGTFNVWPRSANEQIDRKNELLLAKLRQGGKAVLEFLQWVMRERINVILSGGTSSGKTTLLNALICAIPEDNRLITIEDTAELVVALSNHIALEANAVVSVRDLVKFALRCRPDRIIIGEVRGAEAFDVMEALNTGHEGSAVSYHANSSRTALPKLESLIRMSDVGALMTIEDLRKQIASTFRFVIHAERHGGMRGPVQILEILGTEGSRYRTRLLFSKYE